MVTESISNEVSPSVVCTVTYSPQDDKLRIYPSARLPKEDYDRVKAAGFGWAPRQECFYAVWTPAREDVAASFAEDGEIEDETRTREERAADRAERFRALNVGDKFFDRETNQHMIVTEASDVPNIGKVIHSRPIRPHDTYTESDAYRLHIQEEA